MMPAFLSIPPRDCPPCDCAVDGDGRYVPCEEHAATYALVLWS